MSFKMTPAQVDMLIVCLGWESMDFNVEVSHTSEGELVVRNLVEGHKTVFPVPDSMTAVSGNPLLDPADLFSTEGDAQIVTSSDTSHHRHVSLGSGFVISDLADKPGASTDAPPTGPFANPDTFVVGPMDPDTSLSEEGEIREVPAAEESV
ncbi:hypothetical protein L218DRAFT_1003233 [Marasmius fiardii PR-910]|nr:hypothetical protein L218DRAFT_1003233 [Marasmius fiardii PR-910]